jgi:CheY-like chemotaxis protein
MPDLSSLTLVALTGFGQDDDRERSLQAGFNAHLTKPTSLDLLKQILRRANRGSYLPPPIINGVV